LSVTAELGGDAENVGADEGQERGRGEAQHTGDGEDLRNAVDRV
jgi:hypothetical protein